jgi:hypothetical protein
MLRMTASASSVVAHT